MIIPDGSASFHSGDTLIIVSHDHKVLDINDIFDDSIMDLGG